MIGQLMLTDNLDEPVHGMLPPTRGAGGTSNACPVDDIRAAEGA